MFKVTQALKDFLIGLGGVAADADDGAFKKAAIKAMAEDKLSEEKLVELTSDPDAKSANVLESLLTKLVEKSGEPAATPAAAPTGVKGGTPAGDKGGDDGPSYLEKLFAGSDADMPSGQPVVRVKGTHEKFSAERKTKNFPDRWGKDQRFPHPFAGQRMFVSNGTDGSRHYIDEPSDLDKAVNGAYVKLCLQNTPNLPRAAKLNDLDRGLLAYALNEMPWVGTIGGDGDGTTEIHLRKTGQKLTPSQQKAILDDGTSGGLEAAPITFDDMLITTPILQGEFFPAVTVVPITRGRRVEGVSMGNLTLAGGGADGTDITLFTTTNFIAAFDTSIFAVVGGVEVGLDFLSDSPIDVASALTAQYGPVLLNFLDRAVANGDGTTEPTGIVNASGTVSVNGGSAAPTVGVYESFFFGVAKKYKQGYPSERIMFGANETTYSRARAIAVSGSDARRIFGMTHGDYQLMGHKYGISDELGNTKAFYGNMARYRMYRRLGQTVKATTEGKTLVRQNMMLITARSRWGGQPEDGAAFAVSSTMQA